MYPEVFFGEKNRDSASLKMNNGTPGYTLARSGGITVALYALAATKKYTVDQLIQIARRVLSGTPCACQKVCFGEGILLIRPFPHAGRGGMQKLEYMDINCASTFQSPYCWSCPLCGCCPS